MKKQILTETEKIRGKNRKRAAARVLDADTIKSGIWPMVVCRAKKCRHQQSVTQGTIFQDSHVPLVIWFRAMWYNLRSEKWSKRIGITAESLSGDLSDSLDDAP